MAGLVLCLASLASASGPGRAVLPAAATEATVGGNPPLPRTNLEAEARDNGHTAQTPYLLWSGAASVVVVVGGGLLFKRRFDRENREIAEKA